MHTTLRQGCRTGRQDPVDGAGRRCCARGATATLPAVTTQIVSARAPGRVTLIGDHTDYSGGLCFPMAIDRGVTVTGTRRGDGELHLRAAGHPDLRLRVDEFDGSDDAPTPATVEPEWGRFVAGVVAGLRPTAGFDGEVTSDLPAGAGLSSSAALEVAVALALGADAADPLALARLCQRAEHAARGVRTGLLDQLASICGTAGHGLLIDCAALTVMPAVLPPSDVAEWVVVHTGARSLAASQYEQRVDELAAVERLIGPLRAATEDDLDQLDDPVLRRRGRHVVGENARVAAFAAAVGTDLDAAGELMNDSHRSLRDDYESSTPVVDEVWQRLVTTPGVHGARITGAGWGGCVVALADSGAIDLAVYRTGGLQAWTVRPSAGASVGPAAGAAVG